MFGAKKGPMIGWAAKGVPPGTNNKVQGIGLSKSISPVANKIPSMNAAAAAGTVTAKVEQPVKVPSPIVTSSSAPSKQALPVASFKIAQPPASSTLVSKLPPSLHSSTSTMEAPPVESPSAISATKATTITVTTTPATVTATATITKTPPPPPGLLKKHIPSAPPSSGSTSVHKTVSSSPSASAKNVSGVVPVAKKETVVKSQTTPLLQVALPPPLPPPSNDDSRRPSDELLPTDAEQPDVVTEEGEDEEVPLHSDNAREKETHEEGDEEEGLVDDLGNRNEMDVTESVTIEEPSPAVTETEVASSSTTTVEPKKKHKSRARPIPSLDDSESAVAEDAAESGETVVPVEDESGETAVDEEEIPIASIGKKKQRKRKSTAEQVSAPIASSEEPNDDETESIAEQPKEKRPYKKKFLLDEHGNPVIGEDGNPVPKPRQPRTKKVLLDEHGNPLIGEDGNPIPVARTPRTKKQPRDVSSSLMDVDTTTIVAEEKQVKVKKPRAKKEKIPKAESSGDATADVEGGGAKPAKKPRMTRKIRLQAIIDIISPHGLAWIDSDNAIRVKIPQVPDDADDADDHDPADNTESNIAARMVEDFVAGDDENDDIEDDDVDDDGLAEENDCSDENGRADNDTTLHEVVDADPELLLSAIGQKMDEDVCNAESDSASAGDKPALAAKLESGEVIMIVSEPSSSELSLANIVSGKRSRRTILVVDPVQPNDAEANDENGEGVGETNIGEVDQYSEDESMKSDDGGGGGDETYLLDEVEPNNEYYNITDEFRSALVVAFNLYTKLLTDLEKAEEAKRLKAAATGLPPKKRGRPSKKQQLLGQSVPPSSKSEEAEDDSYMEGPPATKKQKKVEQPAESHKAKHISAKVVSSLSDAGSHDEDADDE